MNTLVRTFFLISLCFLSSVALAQYDEVVEEEEYEYQYKGNKIKDNENRGLLYDETKQKDTRRRKRNNDDEYGNNFGGFLNMNGLNKPEDRDEDIEKEELEVIPTESNPFDKANEEIDPDEDPRHDHPPSNPSEPDLPIDGGVGFALVGGILYATRQLLKNKKAV